MPNWYVNNRYVSDLHVTGTLLVDGDTTLNAATTTTIDASGLISVNGGVSVVSGDINFDAGQVAQFNSGGGPYAQLVADDIDQFYVKRYTGTTEYNVLMVPLSGAAPDLKLVGTVELLGSYFQIGNGSRLNFGGTDFDTISFLPYVDDKLYVQVDSGAGYYNTMYWDFTVATQGPVFMESVQGNHIGGNAMAHGYQNVVTTNVGAGANFTPIAASMLIYATYDLTLILPGQTVERSPFGPVLVFFDGSLYVTNTYSSAQDVYINYMAS